MSKKLSDCTLEELTQGMTQFIDDRILLKSAESDKRTILSKRQVCRMQHIGPYTLDKYIANGLLTLPDGRISLFNLNRYLDKYPDAKNSIK